jgi:hypothetical protein
MPPLKKIDRKKSKISSGLSPGIQAPTIAPALVPAIRVGRMFCSSKNLIAPA